MQDSSQAANRPEVQEMMAYAVSVLLESLHEPPLPLHQQLWMEVVYLRVCESREQAENDAKNAASEYESEYVNAGSEMVRWRYRAVAGVWPVPGQFGGSFEVLSRFLRASEAISLLAPFEDDWLSGPG